MIYVFLLGLAVGVLVLHARLRSEGSKRAGSDVERGDEVFNLDSQISYSPHDHGHDGGSH